MVLDGSWNYTTLQYGHQGVTFLHVTALSMGIVNWILNGIIWLAFAITPTLLTKSHLYLFYGFAITNSFTGFFTIPTYVNLMIHNNLNCPRWTIFFGSVFEIALDRVRCVLTLAIAIERIYALCFPGQYFFLNHKKVAFRTFEFAAFWGILDATFMVFEDDITAVRVHCVTTSSSGPIFHWYFLLTAIFFGLFLTLVYFSLICRLFVLKGNQVLLNKKSCRENFNQANNLTVMVILMVLLFSVLPSSLYLYDMIVGQVVFMRWGPIITIGYHCYGILSFFFYNCKHRDIRNALNKFTFLKQCLNYSRPSVSHKCSCIPKNTRTTNSNSHITIDIGKTDNTDSYNDEVFL